MEGKLLFFTGLPCSGKTTIAKYLCQILNTKAIDFHWFDGDVFRKELCSDLGYSTEDRNESAKRITFVCKAVIKHIPFVVLTTVSPTRELRQKYKDVFANFVEIHVKASPELCAKRDVKGMWAKAKSGEIKGFTGWDAPYEEPLNPNIICNTEIETLDECVNKILNYIGVT